MPMFTTTWKRLLHINRIVSPSEHTVCAESTSALDACLMRSTALECDIPSAPQNNKKRNHRFPPPEPDQGMKAA